MSMIIPCEVAGSVNEVAGSVNEVAGSVNEEQS